MYSSIFFKSLFFVCLGDVMVTPFYDFLNFPEWLGNAWRIVCTCRKALRVAFRHTERTAATIAYVGGDWKTFQRGEKKKKKRVPLFQTRTFFMSSWVSHAGFDWPVEHWPAAGSPNVPPALQMWVCRWDDPASSPAWSDIYRRVKID